MSDQEREVLPLKVAPFNIHGLLHALGESPISTLHKKGPSLPRRGTMNIGGSVTLADGSLIQVELDGSGFNPGDEVWVFTQGQHTE